MSKMKLEQQLAESKILDYTKSLAPQIEPFIVELSNKNYVLFDLLHFIRLQSYETQAKCNYLVVERQKHEFVIYDNVHFREEHNRRFTDSEKVAAYVELLLKQKTVFDYAQSRSVTEKGVNFGDDVVIHRPASVPVHGKVISYKDVFPEEVEKLSNTFQTTLFYRPYKNDGTLSNVKPRIIYGNYEIEKI